MSKNKQGTWIPLPPGLRQALDLYVAGLEENRTEFVQQLIEDHIIEKLENLPHDVGETLGRIYSDKDIPKHYRELVKRVYLRQGKSQIVQEEEVMEEPNGYDEIDESIIDSIAKSS